VLGIVLLGIWGGGALWVGKYKPDWLVYYGATCVAFGPRPAIYAYVILLPMLMKIMAILPREAAVVWGVFSVPLGMLAILEWTDAGLVVGIGYSTGIMVLGLVYQVLTIAFAIGLVWKARARQSTSA
jgi:hypothetical protein